MTTHVHQSVRTIHWLSSRLDTKHLRRQILRRAGSNVGQAVIVRLRRQRHNCVVSEQVAPRRQLHAANLVAMTVGKLTRGQIVAQGERFEDHRVVAIQAGAQVQKQHRRAGNFVNQAATDPHRHIEFRSKLEWPHTGSKPDGLIGRANHQELKDILKHGAALY